MAKTEKTIRFTAEMDEARALELRLYLAKRNMTAKEFLQNAIDRLKPRPRE